MKIFTTPNNGLVISSPRTPGVRHLIWMGRCEPTVLFAWVATVKLLNSVLRIFVRRNLYRSAEVRALIIDQRSDSRRHRIIYISATNFQRFRVRYVSLTWRTFLRSKYYFSARFQPREVGARRLELKSRATTSVASASEVTFIRKTVVFSRRYELIVADYVGVLVGNVFSNIRAQSVRTVARKKHFLGEDE